MCEAGRGAPPFAFVFAFGARCAVGLGGSTAATRRGLIRARLRALGGLDRASLSRSRSEMAGVRCSVFGGWVGAAVRASRAGAGTAAGAWSDISVIGVRGQTVRGCVRTRRVSQCRARAHVRRSQRRG